MNKILEVKNFPRHIAFIMDGNRRWAKKKNRPIIEGHKMGSKVIKKIVKKSLKVNIKYLTFFGFSTENWNRKASEVNDLQNLLEFYLDSELENFMTNKINFSVIGEIKKFKGTIIKKLENFQKVTKKNNNLFFILALGYGSRSEIINSILKMKNYKKESVNTEFQKNLMTNKIPDPDLVIRTSGEMRISNFLLWQIAYSELYFTKTLWPDFDSYKYQLAINNYIKRKRRYGSDIL